VDEILPIVEAADAMDLVTVREGDISLTSTGQTFIAGGIDERKQIIRAQLLAHIRLVQQVYHLLQAKRNQRIPEELILDILEAHFSPKEAVRQLDTAIDWGRYAELYSYDEPAGEIFLEQVPVVEEEPSQV
jgi:NitT/TauT family transport system ATP-binding protein